MVYAAHWKASGKKIVVPAGKRELVLSSTFELGFSKPSGFVHPTPVTADLKPGRDYVVRGHFNPLQELKVHLWVEDKATGKPVSERLKLPCPFHTPRPAPIILPVGWARIAFVTIAKLPLRPV